VLVGYARTSTVEQVAGFDAQIRDLKEIGCQEIFSEQVSSVATRAELAIALRSLRAGDVLVVTKLDRLARSMRDLLDIVARIEAKGASLRILAMGLDTSTATGRLTLNVLGSVAQHEREIMRERQLEGIAKAKAAGKFKGRPRSPANVAEKVRELHGLGKSFGEIATELKISKSHAHKIVTQVNA
jgi:DNA invertase Pin-like site-specific DNA recombinase